MALLTWLAVCVFSWEATLDQRGNSFLLVYLPLVAAGYFYWYQVEKEKDDPHWIKQMMVSIALGVAFFGLDVLLGKFHDPSLTIIDAATSKGIMFGITMIICPGFTFVAFAGWVRSKILRSFLNVV